LNFVYFLTFSIFLGTAKLTSTIRHGYREALVILPNLYGRRPLTWASACIRPKSESGTLRWW